MELYLVPITRHNWEEAIALKVLPAQDQFVASNLYSLAQAKAEPEWNCRGIVVEESFRQFVKAVCGRRSYDYKIRKRESTDTRKRVSWRRRRMVGFIMDGHQVLGEKFDGYWICRFMLAADYQGKGFGRMAMKALLEDVRRCGYHQVYISFVPENAAAKGLYTSFGFADTGEMDDGEAIYALKMSDLDKE